jgi:hypothetical protein
MNRFARLTNEFLRKMENNGRAAAIRLRGGTGKPRLIGTVIGIIFMILLALWLAHH